MRLEQAYPVVGVYKPGSLKRPRALRAPRRCHCGHQLVGDEEAFYFMGHWTCPKCLKNIEAASRDDDD